jgi:3-dehydroquinate dehydratase
MTYKVIRTFRDDKNGGKWYKQGDTTTDDLSAFASLGLATVTLDAAKPKVETAEAKPKVETATAPSGKGNK